MVFINWDETFSVGVAAFDADHRKLVALLNNLLAACEAGQGPEVLGEILAGVVAYTKYHFRREERLLRAHGFPGLADHEKEHRDLIASVERLQRRFKTDSSHALGNQTARFLGRWVTDHIIGTDKESGAFLNSRGIF